MDIMLLMKIYLYETASGNSPVKKFIDKLSKRDQARFLEVFEEVEEYGLNAIRAIFKPIEGKLWEIKFKSETKGYRILYVLLEKDMMVWLHTFAKKTQKTPAKELKVARKRMKEVLS
jgi:phage-related protein